MEKVYFEYTWHLSSRDNIKYKIRGDTSELLILGYATLIPNAKAHETNFFNFVEDATKTSEQFNLDYYEDRITVCIKKEDTNFIFSINVKESDSLKMNQSAFMKIAQDVKPILQQLNAPIHVFELIKENNKYSISFPLENANDNKIYFILRHGCGKDYCNYYCGLQCQKNSWYTIQVNNLKLEPLGRALLAAAINNHTFCKFITDNAIPQIDFGGFGQMISCKKDGSSLLLQNAGSLEENDHIFKIEQTHFISLLNDFQSFIESYREVIELIEVEQDVFTWYTNFPKVDLYNKEEHAFKKINQTWQQCSHTDTETEPYDYIRPDIYCSECTLGYALSVALEYNKEFFDFYKDHNRNGISFPTDGDFEIFLKKNGIMFIIQHDFIDYMAYSDGDTLAVGQETFMKLLQDLMLVIQKSPHEFKLEKEKDGSCKIKF